MLDKCCLVARAVLVLVLASCSVQAAIAEVPQQDTAKATVETPKENFTPIYRVGKRGCPPLLTDLALSPI